MDHGPGRWEQYPAKRREVARKILPAFSTKAIKAKEPTVQIYIDLFVDKMKEFGNKPERLNLNKVYKLEFFIIFQRLFHFFHDSQ